MNNHRLWGIALGVSLTVNAFCIAALVTNVFAPRHERGDRPPPLPPEARALFREINPRQIPGFRESMAELRQHRDTVRLTLTADPFDREKLNAALAQLRQSEAKKTAYAHQKIAEVAAGLAPEQREKLAKFVGRHRGMPPPDDRGGRPPPRPEP
ncbi:MAG: periplasmic heavy metal sensor [Oceanococcus sp.]